MDVAILLVKVKVKPRTGHVSERYIKYNYENAGGNVPMRKRTKENRYPIPRVRYLQEKTYPVKL